MKKCGYCGRENSEDVAACSECGTGFASDKAATTEAKPEVAAPALGSKIYFIVAAFALALLAMLPLGGLLAGWPLLILYFPCGLLAWSRHIEAPGDNVVAAWIFYAAVITVVMLSRRRTWFILFYVFLCVVLATNVVGCYKVVVEMR